MGLFGNAIAGIRARFGGSPSPNKGGADAKPDPARRIQTVPYPFAAPPLNETRMLNDDGVYAVYMLFKQTLLGAGFSFVGKDAEQHKAITDAITAAPGFAQMMDGLAAAPFQRFSASEIVWSTENGWLPLKYRVLPNEATTVSLDGFQEVDLVRVSTSAGLQELPVQNAIVFRYRPTFTHNLGISVYDHLKEVIDYKRRVDAAIVRYIERFAAPSVIGWYQPGMSNADQKALLTALQAFQAASVGVMPGPQGKEGNDIQLLEADGSGGGINIAVEMLGNYERRIARAVLGSVLALFESQFGTRAQATVHLDVLKAVITAYQADIEEPVNKQLIGTTLLYNVGPNLDVQFKLNPPSFSDLAKMGQWITDLATAGFLDPETDAEQVRTLFGLDTTPKQALALAKEEIVPVPAPAVKDGNKPDDLPQEDAP